MKKISIYLILAPGVLALFGGVMHTLTGLQPLVDELARQGVDQDTRMTAAIGWLFAGLSMDVFGILVIWSFLDLRRGLMRSRFVLHAVGLLYLLFGLGTFIHQYPNPHFLFFVVVGLLLETGTLLLGSPDAKTQADRA